MHGRVVSLQICPGHRKPMQAVTLIETKPDVGIKGDVHAIPGSSRQVLLIEHETLQELRLLPGDVKENITTQGLRLMDLKRGIRLNVSSSLLTITGPCGPCSRMDEIRPGLRDELSGRRGILAQVTEGGTIHVGDAIAVLS